MKALRVKETWVRYIEQPGAPGAAADRRLHVYIAGLGHAATAAFTETVMHPRLSERRAVLVDLIGTGWSGKEATGFGFTIEEHADTVAAVIEAIASDMRVSEANVIGHSLGGAVALALAHRHPQLVHTLIVAEPNLDPGLGGVSKHIADQDEADFIGKGHALLLRSAAQNQVVTNAIWPATLETWTPIALHKGSTSLLADREPTFREQLKRATMPRAFVRGTKTDTPEILDDLPGAGVAMFEVPDAGHAMMDDNPEGFADALADALAALESLAEQG